MNCPSLLAYGSILGPIFMIFSGCGSKDQKKIEEQKTYNFFYGGGEVSFEAEENEKAVILLPYQLGEITKIEGGGIDSFTMKGTGQAKSGLRFTNDDFSAEHRSLTNPKNAIEMTWNEINNNRRTLLNRFNPELGMNQGEWFWELARRLDASSQVDESTADKLDFQADSAGFGIEDFYRKAASASGRQESVNLTSSLTSSNCPSANVIVPDVESPAELDEALIPSGGVVIDDEFCIVYLSEPKTESDKSKIATSMKKILSIYKSTIYKDSLSPTGDGYIFKPTLVIVDFDENAGKWPSGPAYQVAGAYISAISIKEKHPMIYMSADIEKLKSNKGVNIDKDLANRQ